MNDPDDQQYPTYSYSASLKRNHTGVFFFEADEFHSEVGKSLSVATKGATALYTVPTGKKLHLRTIEYEQVNRAVQRRVVLKDGSGVTKFAFGLQSNVSTYGRQGLIGITFTGIMTITRNSKATGTITIGGVLDPLDDGY